MSGDDLPEWLGRAVLCDELRGLGLPWVPEATWRRPSESFITTFEERLEAVDVSSALVSAMRRRGIPVGDELRAAAWRCTIAGLGRLPRDEWPTRRRDVEERPRPQAAPEADEPADDPLVIRRRGDGRRRGE